VSKFLTELEQELESNRGEESLVEFLKRFEGVYKNKKEGSKGIVTITSMIWPEIDLYRLDLIEVRDLYRPDLIEVGFKSPNFLVFRFYDDLDEGLEEDNLVEERIFEEGKDFALKRGVISGDIGDREYMHLGKGNDAFTPIFFRTEKVTYLLGIDRDGHGKLRKINKCEDYEDFRFERILYTNKLDLQSSVLLWTYSRRDRYRLKSAFN